MSVLETAKMHITSILQSNRTADVVDFGAGTVLLSAAFWADLNNVIHVLIGAGGLFIICIRCRWYWNNRNKKPENDGGF